MNQSEGRLGISDDEPTDTVESLHESGLSAGEGDISLRVYNKGTGSVQFRCRRKHEAYALKTEQNLQLLRRYLTG